MAIARLSFTFPQRGPWAPAQQIVLLDKLGYSTLRVISRGRSLNPQAGRCRGRVGLPLRSTRFEMHARFLGQSTWNWRGIILP